MYNLHIFMIKMIDDEVHIGGICNLCHSPYLAYCCVAVNVSVHVRSPKASDCIFVPKIYDKCYDTDYSLKPLE